MHPRRMVLAVLGIVCATEAIIMLGLPQRLEDQIGSSGVAIVDALLLTLILVPCLWWIIIRPLNQVAHDRQQLLEWALAGQERQAGQLSRDLHDGVGQFAVAMNVGLASLESQTSDPLVIEQARLLRDVGRQMHEAIRDLARGLRPQVLDDIGLAPAIVHYAAEAAATHALTIHVHVADLEGRRWQPELETALYRIAQEGITNTIRHARAQRIDLEISVDGPRIHLSLADDGCGFDIDQVFRQQTDSPKPFGLVSIRERTLLLGGRMRLESTPGRGTRLEVELPWAAETANHA